MRYTDTLAILCILRVSDEFDELQMSFQSAIKTSPDFIMIVIWDLAAERFKSTWRRSFAS